MHNATLKNIRLVARREYLEVVRTKAFMIMTLLTPALMFGFSVVPSLLMQVKSGASSHIVIATADAENGEAIRNRILHKKEPPKSDLEKIDQHNQPEEKTDIKYTIDVSTDMSDAAQKALLGRLDAKELDGVIWLDDKAIQNHAVSYFAIETNNFIELSNLERAVRDALMHRELVAHGIPEDQLQALLKPYDMETIKWEKGHAKKSNEFVQLMSAIFLTVIMYVSVLMYGIGVMRSVLEEKKSRIMEVLMSTLTATELLAGKILGVGFVGITQIAIWTGMGTLISGVLAFSAGQALKDANLSGLTAVYFVIYFILGYLLYSAMCAALGAMVNSEQEAQQLQTLVLMPLIISIMMMMLAITQPNHPVLVIMSMVPFCTPVLMYTRLVVSHPPLWQVLTSIGLMIVTIFAMLWLSSRIYRVGILMYGKKPTLPELLKWIKYA